jgi:hypothetical protein
MTDVKTIVEIVQGIVSIFGIGVGGIWAWMLFVKKRQKYPRAALLHDILHKRISENGVLLHVDVTISNSGDVLLSLVSGFVRVHRVVPLDPKLNDSVTRGQDPVEHGETEIRWPMLIERQVKLDKGVVEIEPGEREQFCFDFILESENKSVEIYSYFKNISKPTKEIGWGLTTIHDLVDSTGKGTIHEKGVG